MKYRLLLLMVLFGCFSVFAQDYTGRSQKGKLIMKPQFTGENKAPQLTAAFLTAAISFRESSGNGFLDAEEEGTLHVTITNTGKTTADNCIMQFEAQNPDPEVDIKFDSLLGTIKYNDTIRTQIRFKATKNVRSGYDKYILKISEKRGFDLEPEKSVSVPTREFQPPFLVMAEYGINDQNRNNILESREPCEVVIRVVNKGETPAYAVKGRIVLAQDVVPLDSSYEYDLGILMPGKYKDISCSFITNARTKVVKMTLEVTEEAGRFGFTKDIEIPFNKTQRRIEDFVIPTSPLAVQPATYDIPSLSLDIATDLPEAAQKKPDAIAIVIGNKNYQSSVPAVEFAHNDAQIMRNYIIKSFGFSPDNVLLYQDATQAQLNALFGTESDYKGKLFTLLRKGQSDVFVYYSGHGAPNPETKKGYLVPVDCDPNNVKLNGYSLSTLYKNLDKICTDKEATQLTIVVDACFSGSSASGNLLTNISPIYVTTEKDELKYPKSTVFTSCSGDQVSNWYPDKKQSMFTYFFLKGIKGDADLDKNGKITAKELNKYVNNDNYGLPYWARRLNSGREQQAEVRGTDCVLYEK